MIDSFFNVRQTKETDIHYKIINRNLTDNWQVPKQMTWQALELLEIGLIFLDEIEQEQNRRLVDTGLAEITPLPQEVVGNIQVALEELWVFGLVDYGLRVLRAIQGL